MKIAVLGIGMMGYPMARRLCAAGHEVHVWNRTLHRAQRLVQDGALVHPTPGDAVRDADIAQGATQRIQFGATAEGKFIFYCKSCGGPSQGPVGYLVIVK